MTVSTRTSPASASRSNNGASTPPNVARSPGNGGGRTPEGGTTAVAVVTGSPGASAATLNWLANAINEDSYDVGTAAHSLCLQAKARSDVNDMIDDVKEATTAVTADNVAVLKAWLGTDTQKVLVVVNKASTSPTAVVLHSPAVADMASTTVTMVAGELDASNRPDIYEVGEEDLQGQELIALPKTAFETAIGTGPDRFQKKPRSSDVQKETWKAAAVAYLPPALVVDDVHKARTVPELYRMVLDKLATLQLTPEQEADVEPMLRQLRGIGTNSKCGDNQHGSNAGMVLTQYRWNEDSGRDRAIRAKMIGMGLEVRPANQPVYQEEEEDDDLEQDELNQGGLNQDDNASQQNLALRFDQAEGTAARGGAGTGITPDIQDLLAKVTQSAVQSAVQGAAAAFGQIVRED